MIASIGQIRPNAQYPESTPWTAIQAENRPFVPCPSSNELFHILSMPSIHIPNTKCDLCQPFWKAFGTMETCLNVVVVLKVLHFDYRFRALAWISSPTILTAISSGVSASMFNPMGECTLAKSSLPNPSRAKTS